MSSQSYVSVVLKAHEQRNAGQRTDSRRAFPAQQADVPVFPFSHSSPVRTTFAYNLTPPFRAKEEGRPVAQHQSLNGQLS